MEGILGYLEIKMDVFSILGDSEDRVRMDATPKRVCGIRKNKTEEKLWEAAHLRKMIQ